MLKEFVNVHIHLRLPFTAYCWLFSTNNDYMNSFLKIFLFAISDVSLVFPFIMILHRYCWKKSNTGFTKTHTL